VSIPEQQPKHSISQPQLFPRTLFDCLFPINRHLTYFVEYCLVRSRMLSPIDSRTLDQKFDRAKLQTTVTTSLDEFPYAIEPKYFGSEGSTRLPLTNNDLCCVSLQGGRCDIPRGN
jgi:hypothetical protein